MEIAGGKGKILEKSNELIGKI